ncbi:hypothetical protein LLH06_00405 [Mucilaginibacter daejeonensis]|uniref:hypothetical protein n=1 Tax=Mucilaginibacter daejeonensis TaxID=398049 RepID=UPI001D170304|nr:hypothetical protein [Mucilaginibacter daejeonensis]UEG53438.1 hypothetical protein LLH06_00405 [Mucilaginibacter daejeonensis]
MITPIAILLTIASMVYLLRKGSQKAVQPPELTEYTGRYIFYRVNLNNEQPLYLDSTGAGKLLIDKSGRSFAFHANDRLIYYRSNYTSTINGEKEKTFTFSDGKATCYWREKRLVLFIHLTPDGMHGNRYELDLSEAT